MTEAAQGPSAAPVSGAPIVAQVSPDNSEVQAGKDSSAEYRPRSVLSGGVGNAAWPKTGASIRPDGIWIAR